MKTANPLTQVLAVIAAVLVFSTALFIGAFVFVMLLGIAVIGGTILSVRLWWLRRQLRRQHHSGDSRHRQGLIIEGEVVRKHEQRRQHH